MYYRSFENSDSDSIGVFEIPIVTDSDSIGHPCYTHLYKHQYGTVEVTLASNDVFLEAHTVVSKSKSDRIVNIKEEPEFIETVGVGLRC